MKIKNIVVTIVFCLFVFGFFALCILHEPNDFSESERRPLAQLPSITVSGVLSGESIKDFDKYTVDQFPFRDTFRSVYMWYRKNVAGIKESNGFAVEDGYISKVETVLYEESLAKVINSFKQIYENLLKDNGGKVYLSLVPDKNYFFANEYGYPSIDYEKLCEAMKNGLSEMEYIDIFGALALSDYYRTDTHWSQDKLLGVADAILGAMGQGKADGDYKVNSLYPFNGVYNSQSLLNLPPDTIYYLTNEILDGCTVFDYETGKTMPLYTLDKFDSREPYDIFLGGTKALLRIDNPRAEEKKELVVFRDSFGSSLIPLLCEGYSSVYVIDIRYVEAAYLGQLIDFEGKDVLFLYSTLIVNSNPAFKVTFQKNS